MQPVVYMLWHSYEMDSGVEESKLIGVYSSEERAKEPWSRSGISRASATIRKAF